MKTDSKKSSRTSQPEPASENSRNGHNGGTDADDHQGHHEHMVKDFRRRFWICLVLSLPIVAMAPLIAQFLGIQAQMDFSGRDYILFALSSTVFVYGGWPFLKGAFDELGEKKPGMMTLIAVAISVAYVYSSAVVFGLPGKTFFWELATLIDIMLLGHWIEMRATMGASGALDELVKLMPAQAHRIGDDGQTEDVPVDRLGRNDRVSIKPGEKVPVDGTVEQGRSSVNEAMISGESKPVEKGPGDQVVGGSINSQGTLTVKVEKTGQETYLSQVVEMVRKAQQSRSKTQDLANRAALWLTLIALGAGGLTLAVWLLTGNTLVYAIERMVTVMVITCPHALGLAVPLVVAISTAMGAKQGLLIRNRKAFERARHLQTVVYDKTGTLTHGRFGVEAMAVLDDSYEEKDILKLAAAVESQSEHPVAQGIVGEADKKDLRIAAAEGVEAIAGKGAKGQVDGKMIHVVSRGYLNENNIDVSQRALKSLADEGLTLAFVLVDSQPVGVVGLDDVVRDESRQAVSQLKQRGLQVMMLTGDAEPVAARVAQKLGLDDYFAEVLPDQKAEKIRELRNRGMTVAMVGDGINDAPALAEADAGIAIGAGTDVAIESAGIVLVKSDPRDIVTVIDLARATYRKMVQNLWWATGYNALAIPLAAGVLFPIGFILPPAAGALVMSLSTVIVAVNAKLLSSGTGRTAEAS